MNKDGAIALSKTKFWEKMTYEEISVFQINEPLLCMPFGVFHEAMEKTIGRSIFTHEFGSNVDGLKTELQRKVTKNES